MLSYEVYKVFHLLGIFLLMVGLGGLIVQGSSGNPEWRRRLGLSHGLGLLLTLIAGFGMLAKLHLSSFPWPGWVMGKAIIWVALGGVIALARRKSALAGMLWWGVIVLASLAGYFAIFKPSFF